jgi:hypothetical protein
MNHKTRRIVETAACERRYGIADAKGAEYSGAGSTYKETGADTLRNFKSVAERVGITPEQALMVYLLKHVDSISTAVREASFPRDATVDPLSAYESGEGIVSRLDDARNYLDLFECVLIDLGLIEYPTEDNLPGPTRYAVIEFEENGVHHSYDPNPTEQRVYVSGTEDEGEWHDAGLFEKKTPAEMDAAHSLGERDFTYVNEQEATERTLGVEYIEPDNEARKQQLRDAGLVECYDGVWRRRTMPEGTPVQTPIFMQAQADPENRGTEFYGETGELT